MKTLLRCCFGLALVIITAAIFGCSGGGGGGDAPYTVSKLTVEPYPVSGLLKETNGLAMTGTITVSAIDGNGAAVNLYSDVTGGNIVTSLVTSAEGMVNFFVDSAALLPVTVKASGTTSVPNHIASSAMFTIDKVGASNFVINVIDMDVPGPGVIPDIKNATLGNFDDLLTTPLNLQNPSALVTIPSGTAFKDGAGAKLMGEVKASLTTFASSTATNPIMDPAIFDLATSDPENGIYTTLAESDLQNFPGGLGNTHRAEGAGYFVTAGFVAVNVTDASGKQAKTVAPGSSFTIRMNIPAGTLNPNDVNEPLLKAGDTIPIFTYDEKDLIWKPEVVGGVPVTGTVLEDANGLYVIHTTNHFSFWNLGWLVKGNSCSATLKLQNDAITLPLNLLATFSKAGKNTLLTDFKPAGDSTITASNVPNQNIDLVLTDLQNNVIWSKKDFNWCKNTPLTASYKAPVSKKPVPVTVIVTEYCKQNPSITQVVPSTLTIVTKNASCKNWLGNIINGLQSISIGVTNINGIFIHYLVPDSYNFYAFDRRTLAIIPATTPNNPITILPATPKTVSIKIPVTCNPVSGSSGGYSF